MYNNRRNAQLQERGGNVCSKKCDKIYSIMWSNAVLCGVMREYVLEYTPQKIVGILSGKKNLQGQKCGSMCYSVKI